MANGERSRRWGWIVGLGALGVAAAIAGVAIGGAIGGAIGIIGVGAGGLSGSLWMGDNLIDVTKGQSKPDQPSTTGDDMSASEPVDAGVGGDDGGADGGLGEGGGPAGDPQHRLAIEKDKDPWK